MIRNLKKSVVILMIIVFIITFSLATFVVVKDYKEYEENDKDTRELLEEVIQISEDTKENTIDWEYLKSVNKDIIGWIEIEGTRISYPIQKDNDSLYYLKHSFNKKYNSNGSIFTTDNKPFECEETTIYGHNMKNGSMFSELGNYLNKNFCNNHLKIKIYTPNGDYIARVFSVYSIGVDVESKNIKSLGFNERINYYINSSQIKINTDTNSSNILKLSTCSYINAKTTPTDQRYYIVAFLEKIN